MGQASLSLGRDAFALSTPDSRFRIGAGAADDAPVSRIEYARLLGDRFALGASAQFGTYRRELIGRGLYVDSTSAIRIRRRRLADPVTAQGGVGALRYAVSPALPEGLTMDENTGIIAGTPPNLSALTTYTATITDDATHSVQTQFQLQVVPRLTATLAVPSVRKMAANTFPDVQPVQAAGGSGDGIAYTVSPPLPTGLSLNRDTGVISSATGTAEAASVTKGDYTVTASDGVSKQSQTFFLEIAPPLIVEWMPPSSTRLVVGQNYPNAIKVTGGVGKISAQNLNSTLFELNGSTAQDFFIPDDGYVSVKYIQVYLRLVGVISNVKDELGNLAIPIGGSDHINKYPEYLIIIPNTGW